MSIDLKSPPETPAAPTRRIPTALRNVAVIAFGAVVGAIVAVMVFGPAPIGSPLLPGAARQAWSPSHRSLCARHDIEPDYRSGTGNMGGSDGRRSAFPVDANISG